MSEPKPHKRRGAIAVLINEDRLLVIRRSQQVVAPGAYCFPGGNMEPGETPVHAVRREVQEELGLAMHPVREIWTSVTPWGVELHWWLGTVDMHTVCSPCAAEVESYQWLTVAEMSDLPGLLESNRHFLHAIQRGEVDLRLV